MSLPPRRPPPAAFLLLLLLPCLIPAVPLHHADPAPEAAWVAHLMADRFTFVPSPVWETHGFVPPSDSFSSRPNHTLARAFTVDHRPAAEEQQQQHLNPTARTTVYPPQEGDGYRSRFEISVHNAPASINIPPVVAKCQQIIQEAWVSEVTVKMNIVFTELGQENLLAKGGGTYFVRLPDLFETILPVAAAESIRKRDLNGNEQGDGKYDILVTMNSNTPWYDGTDGNVPEDKYDICTVMLHEIYHNIVFAGSIVAEQSPREDPNAPGNVIQAVYLHKDYRTRFDSFLANKQHCAILGYLTDTRLQQQQKRNGKQLLADACTNGQLFFTHGSTQIARIFAPRVFKARSSVYHLDPKLSDSESSLMFPTIKRGSSQHRISVTIKNIQAATLRTDWHGANTRCPRPLLVPIAAVPATSVDFHDKPPTDVGVGVHSPNPVPRDVFVDNRRRIANLPVWAFALLIVLAILLALLLLALCLALLFRRKKTTIYSSTSRSTSKYPTTHSSQSRSSPSRTHTDSKITSYTPGVGGRASSTKTHSRSNSFSRSHSESKHTTSKHTTSKSSTKHSRSKSETHDSSKKVCPSSGKYVYICRCKCCCKAVTRPPPVASVHTFDPQSVPSGQSNQKHTHKSHTHKHSAVKSLKKSCKSKSIRSCHHGCHCCYCCKYKPASSKSASKCTKSIAASSTKCETVCKSSTCKPLSCSCKTSLSSSCKSCKTASCICKTPSSSCKSCKTASCSCKTSSSSCKSCKTASCSCKTSSSSCKSCKTASCSCKSSSSSCRTCKMSSCKCDSVCKTSTKGSSSRAPPPSTKPPTVKAPSTKPPSSCKPSSCKPSSCKPSSSAKSCCKSAASGQECQPTCRRVVEININRC